MNKMKWMWVSVALIMASCQSKEENKEEESTEAATEEKAEEGPSTFGEEISEDGALPASELMAKLAESDSVELKLTGTVQEVCQVKGCWMTMDLGNDESMRVKFKDYGFFVPKDASGKTAVVEGWAYREEVSVEHLKHLAEDNGDSEEEIAKITEPQVEYTFMAKGVILK